MTDKILLVLIATLWFAAVAFVVQMTGCMVPTEPDCINYDCENYCWESGWIYTTDRWYWRQWELACE